MGSITVRRVVALSFVGGLVAAGFITNGLQYLMLLCALVGMGLEVFFTASMDDLKKPTEEVSGYSSPLYAPLYAMAPLVYLTVHKLGIDQLHWGWRGMAYTVSLPAIEFAAMAFYDRVLDLRPSKAKYLESGRSILGYTRWDFLPVWFTVGLFFERTLDHLAPLLLHK